MPRRSHLASRDVNCSNSNNEPDSLFHLRVASIFIVLVGAMFGALFPVLARRTKWLSSKIPHGVFDFAKYFGSGVIIATAFIHLLDPAAKALSSPCLGPAWSDYPYAFGIALVAIFSIFIVEIVAFRWGTAKLTKIGLAHDPHGHDIGSHAAHGPESNRNLGGGNTPPSILSDPNDLSRTASGSGSESKHSVKKERDLEKGLPVTSSNLHTELHARSPHPHVHLADSPSNALSRPRSLSRTRSNSLDSNHRPRSLRNNVRWHTQREHEFIHNEEQLRSADVRFVGTDGVATQEDAREDNHDPGHGHAPEHNHSHQSQHDPGHSHLHPSSSGHGHSHKHQMHIAHAHTHAHGEHKKGQRTHEHEGHEGIVDTALAQIVGIGILEFGVVLHSILIGLTLAVDPDFKILFIVIVFHQTFEGLGVGSRLAYMDLPHKYNYVPIAGALLYGITTPVGIAAGLGVRTTYNPGSATASIVSGVLDAFSSGILIYTGLVELLAHEFLFNKTMINGSNGNLAYAIGCMMLGCGIMALLGRWA